MTQRWMTMEEFDRINETSWAHRDGNTKPDAARRLEQRRARSSRRNGGEQHRKRTAPGGAAPFEAKWSDADS